MQSKSHLLPERRSRRLKSEVSHIFYGLQKIHPCAFFLYTVLFIFRSLSTLCRITLFNTLAVFFQRENKEPKGLKIFDASPKMVGLEIVAGKCQF